jgi:DNA-binding transcriptional regulator YhcF (GntR family)
MFQIENQNPQPAYTQLFLQIVEKIRAGKIKRGERLLPEREMAKLTGLARGTITHAYKKLKKEGIVSSRIGSGYYIVDPEQDLSRARNQAEQLITQMFSRLEALKLSNSEVFTFITRKLMDMLRPAIKIRVALVECNNSGIDILAKDLSHIKSVDYSPILLSEISQRIRDSHLAEFDFFITTASHYKELSENLPHLSRKIEQVFFSLTQESIAEFATIHPHTKIGVLCINSHTNAVIKRTLDSFRIPYQSFDSCGQVPTEGIRRYILQKDVLIIEPSSRIFDEKSNLRHIDEFISRGGFLVRFHRNVERGSVRHIEEIISKLLMDRYMALLTPSIHMAMGAFTKN